MKNKISDIEILSDFLELKRKEKTNKNLKKFLYFSLFFLLFFLLIVFISMYYPRAMFALIPLGFSVVLLQFYSISLVIFKPFLKDKAISFEEVEKLKERLNSNTFNNLNKSGVITVEDIKIFVKGKL